MSGEKIDGSFAGASLDDLKGRVAIVTGAGQGLGRAFAQAYCKAGASVVVAERNAERGEAVAAALQKAGHGALFVRTDVSDAASVAAMAQAAMARFRRIDILVNNAAIFSTIRMRSFDEIPLEEWNEVMNVNVTGCFLSARAVLPAMKSAGWGRIINISSGTVTMGRPQYLHYVTSKAALIGMSRSMAREVGKFGINVNTILPGATLTEVPRETVTDEQRKAIVAMQCIPRIEEPGDLVGPVLFLSSEASRFVTGQSITVDGGVTHL
ncbi:MAG: glucose 1-dehydrogenase [Rhodospirillaceae bacterium]|nr:glucose 1-dehydrogenase [Rhodospirillaceae bacterium]